MTTNTTTPDFDHLAEHAPAMHRQFEATLAMQAAFERMQAAEAKATNAGDMFAVDLTYAGPADAEEADTAALAYSAAKRDLAAATMEVAYQLLAAGLVR